MTEHDLSSFGASFRRLAASLSSRQPDPQTVTDAFEDCRQFPLSVVEAALESLRRSSRYMPRPYQLIDACHEAHRAEASSAGYNDVPSWVKPDQGVFFCADCQDTGWMVGLICAGNGACGHRSCGKAESLHNRVVDPSHGYTRRCACITSNPVIARQRALAARHQRTDRDAA